MKPYHKLLLLFAPLLLLVANSCEKEPEEIHLEIDEELSSMIEYDVGSYWILEDTTTGELDSIYVDSYSSSPLQNELLRARGFTVFTYNQDTMKRQYGIRLSGVVEERTPIYDIYAEACSDSGLSISMMGSSLSTANEDELATAYVNINNDNQLFNDTLLLLNEDGSCQVEFVSGVGITKLRDTDGVRVLVRNSLVKPQ